MTLELRCNNSSFSISLVDLKLAEGKTGAKNHAICDGAEIIAQVVPKGYPVAEGWSPISEAYAHILAAAPRLIKACHMALEQEEGWKEACENALALPKITVSKKGQKRIAERIAKRKASHELQ